MIEIEDSRILELIRLGKDREVMPLFYKKVLPQLKSYISKNNGEREDAYDVFHDALILFYEQVIGGVFDPKYNVFGYLYRIAVYRWINKMKKDKSMIFSEELPERATVEESWTQFDSKGLEKDHNLLKSLFSQIGGKCVELLTYTIYSDMLMEDVMARMNFASVDAVRMQHMRCKQKLLKEMESNPALLRKLKGE